MREADLLREVAFETGDSRQHLNRASGSAVNGIDFDVHGEGRSEAIEGNPGNGVIEPVDMKAEAEGDRYAEGGDKQKKKLLEKLIGEDCRDSVRGDEALRFVRAAAHWDGSTESLICYQTNVPRYSAIVGLERNLLSGYISSDLQMMWPEPPGELQVAFSRKKCQL